MQLLRGARRSSGGNKKQLLTLLGCLIAACYLYSFAAVRPDSSPPPLTASVVSSATPPSTSSSAHAYKMLPYRPPTTEFDIDPRDMSIKYFVYQPSGGWGNQRLILRWAMRAANAMNRTLIVPNIAPHNMMWYGYDRINASDSMHADQVLEMRALQAGVVRGVRVFRGHLNDLPALLPGSWRRHSAPSTTWLKANAIQAKWRGLSERVVFWRKGSMWECCGGGMLMSPYVVFSQRLRELSLRLAQNLFRGAEYNSAHVRRGGGHTRIERKSAKHFLDLKLVPQSMLQLPLFIATDEKNKTWFDGLRPRVQHVYFWSDVVEASPREVEDFLLEVPLLMRNDAIGFLEQLICARASKFAGSEGSTFSFAISGMRANPNSLTTNRHVDWAAATKNGVILDENEEETRSSSGEDGQEEEEDGEEDDDV